MRIGKRIANTAKDLWTFGPSFVVSSNLARLKRGRIATVNIPGVGPVHFRAGNSDLSVLRQVFLNNEYDLDHPAKMGRRIRDRYEAILAAGRKPIIVDAGANIGASALLFDRLFPKARIVSIEPDRGNCEILRRNVGQRPNHVILEAAIGSSPGFVSVSNEALGWAVQTERAEHGLRIVTVDQAFAASGGDDPLMVKVDIEGFETDLFADNLDWIDKTYVIAVEPHDWMMPGRFTSSTFQRALAAHRFEVYIKGENLLYVRA